MSETKQLHYHLYHNGNIGMCNLLMSMEVALAIGYLTNRKPILYAEKPLFNSKSNVFIEDLFDVNGVDFKRENLSTNTMGMLLPPNLMTTAITIGKAPSPDFMDGRKTLVDLRDYEIVERLSTSDHNTLGFYSYLFCLTDYERERVIEHIKNAIVPKAKYQNHANQYVNWIRANYGNFNSIQVRRKDYLEVEGTKGKAKEMSDFVDVLLEHIPTDELLLIHTDETKEQYFQIIKKYYPRVMLIDLELSKSFKDDAECGLVSMLIASQSNNYVGTMYSTFSEMIRRKRLQNGLKENFVYLYSQDENIKLSNGLMIEPNEGQYTWNRIEMPQSKRDMNFWWREWRESVL